MTGKNAIFYFSGTGNSLFVAAEIVSRIGGKLISIASVMANEHITIEADVIGIIFPVYYATNDCGLPLIIRRFVPKLQGLNSKYIFAVCTCGNMPGTTLENFEKLLKSQDGLLAAGFNLKMSDKTLTKEKQDEAFTRQRKKLDAICKYVRAEKNGKKETRGILRKIVLAPLLYLAIKPAFSRRYRKLSGAKKSPFSELVPLADQSFQVSAKCNGCGICAHVCPVNNVELVDCKPTWRHHCETCLACYSWCPQAAIGGDIVSYNERYHHPSVSLSDMLRAKE